MDAGKGYPPSSIKPSQRSSKSHIVLNFTRGLMNVELAPESNQQASQTRHTRRCADCRREFGHHQEYQGSPRGIVCRNRRECAERAAPVNGRRGKLYVHTISDPFREPDARPIGGRSKLYVHTISKAVSGDAR